MVSSESRKRLHSIYYADDCIIFYFLNFQRHYAFVLENKCIRSINKHNYSRFLRIEIQIQVEKITDTSIDKDKSSIYLKLGQRLINMISIPGAQTILKKNRSYCVYYTRYSTALTLNALWPTLHYNISYTIKQEKCSMQFCL